MVTFCTKNLGKKSAFPGLVTGKPAAILLPSRHLDFAVLPPAILKLKLMRVVRCLLCKSTGRSLRKCTVDNSIATRIWFIRRIGKYAVDFIFSAGFIVVLDRGSDRVYVKDLWYRYRDIYSGTWSEVIASSTESDFCSITCRDIECVHKKLQSAVCSERAKVKRWWNSFCIQNMNRSLET